MEGSRSVMRRTFRQHRLRAAEDLFLKVILLVVLLIGVSVGVVRLLDDGSTPTTQVEDAGEPRATPPGRGGALDHRDPGHDDHDRRPAGAGAGPPRARGVPGRAGQGPSRTRPLRPLRPRPLAGGTHDDSLDGAASADHDHQHEHHDLDDDDHFDHEAAVIRWRRWDSNPRPPAAKAGSRGRTTRARIAIVLVRPTIGCPSRPLRYRRQPSWWARSGHGRAMEPVVGPEPDVPSAQLHCCHPTPEDHIRRVRRMSFISSTRCRSSVGLGSNSGTRWR